jgi:ATP-dependent Clp protease ATP-binding subunit ClpA
MKISVSSDLVWKIAIREAATGEFKEIEPDHFCLAVLKFAELSAKGVEEAGAEAELSQHIAGDAQLVREGLQKCGIESTGARRKLRRQLGKGDTPHIGVTIHRSASSRALFESAARLASESGSAVTPLHLLTALVEAPTPAIEQAVLGKAPEPPSPTALPLLDKHDRDLVKRLAEEKIQVKPGIAAQSKALLQALEQKNRKSILLVSHSDDRVADLAAALAGAIAAKGAPDGLKGRRLMDISENSRHHSPKGKRQSSEEKKAELERLRPLLAEAASHQEVILLVPAMEADSKEERGDRWAGLLRETLAQGKVQFICRVAPSVFTENLQKDAVWKRKSQAIWLESIAQASTPREL